MAGKTMPHNIEAEKSVLGACFLSKHALEKSCESLLAESFYNDANSKLFSCLQKLLEEHTPVDLTTVTTSLKEKKILK